MRELQKNTRLKGIHLKLVALPERDETGCNWSVAARSGAGGTQRETTAHLTTLVSDFQKKYNAVGKLPQNAASAD